MAYAKTDIQRRCTVDEAIRDAILAISQGNEFFRYLAPYGETTTTVPLSKALMVQNYDLTLAADLEDVLRNMGHRASVCSEILATSATPV
jgi:hypothetical protein